MFMISGPGSWCVPSMSGFTFLVLLVLVATQVAAQTGTCGFNGIDMTSVSHRNLGQSDYTFNNSYHHYFLNPCSVTRTACDTDKWRSPGILVNVLGPDQSNCNNLGRVETGTWRVLSDSEVPIGDKSNGGLAVKYIDGDTCQSNNTNYNLTLDLRFFCGDLNSVTDIQVSPTNACDFIFWFQTPLLCAVPPPPSTGSGLSGGWVFIILLVVFSSLYCGVGAVWNWQARGLKGVEVVPNLEFWHSLPGLVKDGANYAWVKVTTCGRSDQSQYDNIGETRQAYGSTNNSDRSSL